MLDLQKYVPNGRVSTGLITCHQGMLVWAVGQEKYWRHQDSTTIIPLIGIGGGQESGESLQETITRECLEEANAEIELCSSDKTLWISADTHQVHMLAQNYPDEPMPVLIWESRVTLRTASGLPYEIDYINAVYSGALRGIPSPGSEIPGLLSLPVELFLRLHRKALALEVLLSSGAAYTGRALDTKVRFALQGSALYVAQHWDHVDKYLCRG